MSNHPHWRLHSPDCDDCTWLREIETCKVMGPDGYRYEPVWINPVDAARLGIEHGDIVKLYNERGVDDGRRLRDRAHHAPCGAAGPWRPHRPHRGGGAATVAAPTTSSAPKAVASKNCAGEVTSGYLVGVEKVDVFELARQYPEAFSKPYDPDYGVLQDAWFDLD